MICPYYKNKEVFDLFNNIIRAFGGRPMTEEEFRDSALRHLRTGRDYSAMEAAYKLYHENNGNFLDSAPDGSPSTLFLMLLNEFEGDESKAIVAKSKIYSSDFIKRFGDWLHDDKSHKTLLLDSHKEPLIFDVLSNKDLMFHINPKNEQALKKAVYKKQKLEFLRTQIEVAFEFLKELENNQENNAYVECCIRWLKNGTVMLPRDNEKIREIFNQARKKHIDVQRAKSPIDLLLQIIDTNPVTSFKQRSVDITAYPEFMYSHSEMVNGKKIDVYNVLNDDNGLLAVVQYLSDSAPLDSEGHPICFSPWCLSTYHYSKTDNKVSPTESSLNHWRHYNAGKRQLAVYEGKPVAFNSSILPRDQWWDFFDRPHNSLQTVSTDVAERVYKTEYSNSSDQVECLYYGRFFCTILNGKIITKHIKGLYSFVEYIDFQDVRTRLHIFSTGLSNKFLFSVILNNELLSGVEEFTVLCNFPVTSNPSEEVYFGENARIDFERLLDGNNQLLFTVDSPRLHLEYPVDNTIADEIRTILLQFYKKLKLSSIDNPIMPEDANVYFNSILAQILPFFDDIYVKIKDEVKQAIKKRNEKLIKRQQETDYSTALSDDPDIIRAILDGYLTDYRNQVEGLTAEIDGTVSDQILLSTLLNRYRELVQAPANAELSNVLLNILREFHFEIIEGTIQEVYGDDILGAFDYLQKIIYLAREGDRNAITEPEEFSHAFIKMMGSVYHLAKNRERWPETKEYSELRDLIEQTDFFHEVYDKYKFSLNYLYPNSTKPNLPLIKEEALGKALAIVLNELYTKYSQDKIEKEKGFFNKLKLWFKHALLSLVDYIRRKSGRMNAVEELEYRLKKIASSILDGTYYEKYLKKVDSSKFVLQDYTETIRQSIRSDGGMAIRIMLALTALDGHITGSMANRYHGTIFRPTVDSLHDIDCMFGASVHNLKTTHPHIFNYYRQKLELSREDSQLEIMEALSSNENTARILSEFKSQFPSATLLYAFYGDDNIIVNMAICEDLELILEFLTIPGNFNHRLEVLLENHKDRNIYKELYLIDLFFDGYDISDGDVSRDILNNISLTNYTIPFKYKLEFSRAKDLYDYQHYNPSHRNPILALNVMYQIRSQLTPHIATDEDYRLTERLKRIVHAILSEGNWTYSIQNKGEVTQLKFDHTGDVAMFKQTYSDKYGQYIRIHISDKFDKKAFEELYLKYLEQPGVSDVHIVSDGNEYIIYSDKYSHNIARQQQTVVLENVLEMPLRYDSPYTQYFDQYGHIDLTRMMNDDRELYDEYVSLNLRVLGEDLMNKCGR